PSDRAPDEADDGLARSFPARRRRGGDGAQRRRARRARPRSGARVRSPSRQPWLAPRAAHARRSGDRQRRPREGAPGHPYPARQRPHAHTGGHEGDRDDLLRKPPRRVDRLRRRPGHSPTRSEADIRALLHRRESRRVGARTGDRDRAGATDAWQDRDQLQPALHRIYARPAARPARSREIPRPRPGRLMRRISLSVTAPLSLAILLVALALTGCGSGETANVDGGRTGEPQRPQVIVEAAAPGFDAAKVFEEASPGVVTIRSVFGSGEGGAEGSGFVLDADGRIVTNAHVVTDEAGGEREVAKAVFVEFSNRNVLPAEIVGFDPFADVALLEVEPN